MGVNMYDFTVDEFPINDSFVVHSIHTGGCPVNRGGEFCRCLELISAGELRRVRKFHKARANRGQRRAVNQMLHTWDRVKQPRHFTCWDII